MSVPLLDERVVIVHIGKTGGTSVKQALLPFFEPSKVCPLQFERQYPTDLSELNKYSLFDSHIGYDVASQLGGKLITVLRNPYDRLVSLYYYWREVEPKTAGPGVAKELSFERFLDVARDIHVVAVDAFNAMTWQLAYGTTMEQRRAHYVESEDDILKKALENLETFACVGVTENLDLFWERLGLVLGVEGRIAPARANVTNNRIPITKVPMSLRRKMTDLLHLDMALYDAVLMRYGFR